MKRGLKCVIALHRAADRQRVKEDSPMKRGLKWRTSASLVATRVR